MTGTPTAAALAEAREIVAQHEEDRFSPHLPGRRAQELLLNAIAAALDRARAEREWRTIETAPKDGRKALVFRPLAEKSGDCRVAVKRLIGGNNHCWESTVPAGQKPTNPTDGACHVTHWMDIPPPPPKSAP